jgi:anhydro-N-acetylmuramic acid kinase
MDLLRARLPDTRVADTSVLGMDPQQVEAVAFAWLARQFVLGRPGNLPSVTRSRSAAVLGCLHPGNEKTSPLC